jgi:guanylate kinase
MNPARGKLYVISAPSGAGKTSLVKALLQRNPELRFSISYTTRRQRSTEQHGREYFFVDHERFKQMIDACDFLEHARVFDHFYGTSQQQVSSLLEGGNHVLLEIDWQGAQQIRARMPEQISIFVLPPSRAELERRLRGRGTDSDEVIARRLRDSLGDMSHWKEFEYVVINDDFERALGDLQAVVAGNGEKLRADRPQVRQLIEFMQQGY